MGQKLTVWGRWLRKQPRGTLTRAQEATRLAYSTLHYARVRRLTDESAAEALASFARGAFAHEDLLRPSERGRSRKASV
jgi:hypothetical protein